MYASVGWGLTAPLAGWVVAAFGLRAAFLCYTFLVGACLPLAALMPMEVLAAPKAAAQAAPAAGDAGSQLCCQGASFEQLGLGSDGAGTRSDAENFSVHVSGGSEGQLPHLATKEGSRHGCDGSAKRWSIGTALHAAPEPHHTQDPGSSPRPVIHLVADARGGGARLLSSPERPLLSPSSCPSSPDAPAIDRTWHTTTTTTCSTSTLEIAAGPSKARLAGPAGGPGPAGGAPTSVWRGVRALLGDVHVAVFFFLVSAP